MITSRRDAGRYGDGVGSGERAGEGTVASAAAGDADEDAAAAAASSRRCRFEPTSAFAASSGGVEIVVAAEVTSGGEVMRAYSRSS